MGGHGQDAKSRNCGWAPRQPVETRYRELLGQACKGLRRLVTTTVGAGWWNLTGREWADADADAPPPRESRVHVESHWQIGDFASLRILQRWRAECRPEKHMILLIFPSWPLKSIWTWIFGRELGFVQRRRCCCCCWLRHGSFGFGCKSAPLRGRQDNAELLSGPQQTNVSSTTRLWNTLPANRNGPCPEDSYCPCSLATYLVVLRRCINNLIIVHWVTCSG